MNYIQKVHEFTQKIPKGKVTTYGTIAKMLNINPRMVGYALHQNKSSQVPCHRVVNKDGRLAPSFAFDGWKEQKRRLEEEGVKFRGETYVDLDKCLWKNKDSGQARMTPVQYP